MRAEIMAGFSPGPAAGACSKRCVMVKRMKVFIPDFRFQASLVLSANIMIKAVSHATTVEPGIVPCIPPECRDKEYMEIFICLNYFHEC